VVRANVSVGVEVKMISQIRTGAGRTVKLYPQELAREELHGDNFVPLITITAIALTAITCPKAYRCSRLLKRMKTDRILSAEFGGY
jgi:hypothetical protein